MLNYVWCNACKFTKHNLKKKKATLQQNGISAGKNNKSIELNSSLGKCSREISHLPAHWKYIQHESLVSSVCLEKTITYMGWEKKIKTKCPKCTLTLLRFSLFLLFMWKCKKIFSGHTSPTKYYYFFHKFNSMKIKQMHISEKKRFLFSSKLKLP